MTLYAIDGMQPVLPKDNSFWIADDANVIGNVVLGEGVSIWFGATIRAVSYTHLTLPTSDLV